VRERPTSPYRQIATGRFHSHRTACVGLAPMGDDRFASCHVEMSRLDLQGTQHWIR
jgi:hypothetical protein